MNTQKELSPQNVNLLMLHHAFFEKLKVDELDAKAQVLYHFVIGYARTKGRFPDALQINIENFSTRTGLESADLATGLWALADKGYITISEKATCPQDILQCKKITITKYTLGA